MQDKEIIQRVASRIAEAIHPLRIILSGSWARGEGGPQSDSDLLVIAESTQPRPQRCAQVGRLFWGMGIPMDILVHTPEEFARYPETPAAVTLDSAKSAVTVARQIYRFALSRAPEA